MKVKLLHEDAVLPTRGSEHSAGIDLSAYLPTGPIRIKPGERKLIKTGIAVAIASFAYGRVAPRSGLAKEFGLDVMAGVVDRDYRGDVGVIHVNHGERPVTIRNGDRIAQLIEEACYYDPIEQVSELPTSDRGESGFGSTDKAAS